MSYASNNESAGTKFWSYLKGDGCIQVYSLNILFTISLLLKRDCSSHLSDVYTPQWKTNNNLNFWRCIFGAFVKKQRHKYKDLIYEKENRKL